jgi:hypothetical protein
MVSAPLVAACDDYLPALRAPKLLLCKRPGFTWSKSLSLVALEATFLAL